MIKCLCLRIAVTVGDVLRRKRGRPPIVVNQDVGVEKIIKTEGWCLRTKKWVITDLLYNIIDFVAHFKVISWPKCPLTFIFVVCVRSCCSHAHFGHAVLVMANSPSPWFHASNLNVCHLLYSLWFILFVLMLLYLKIGKGPSRKRGRPRLIETTLEHSRSLRLQVQARHPHGKYTQEFVF